MSSVQNETDLIQKEMSPVVVVGTGLAGLTATLSLLLRGVPVTLLEKTARFGGNSAKASSGINGVPTAFQDASLHDSIDSFVKDTIASGKGLSDTHLVETLAKNSESAISWLSGTDSFGIDLSKVAQLGGHSHPRTHRGSGRLPPGFAIISTLTKKLEELESLKKITILRNSRFNKILSQNGKTVGIEYVSTDDGESHVVKATNVVLATGGFSADVSLPDSLMAKYRPDLLEYPLTNAVDTTGDSQKIAARDVNAALVHMDKVQVHPTGFVKLGVPDSKWKFICGELIRGIGGILISPTTGERFVNELDTRDVVSKAIEDGCEINANNEYGIPANHKVAIILVSEQDYAKAQTHIDFYVSQGLMFKSTIGELAAAMKKLNSEVSNAKLANTFKAYDEAIAKKDDTKLGRSVFGNQFLVESEEDSYFYYGLVTPVLHFTMGGIRINERTNVISNDGSIVPNLYAVGEVSGGLHGANRLGGSSLLECVVFGRIVADEIYKNSYA